MNRCPHCRREIETVLVTAPAELVTSAIVTAEIALEELPIMQIERDYHGNRYLPSFRLHGVIERIEDLGHRNLEIDHANYKGKPDVDVNCPECDGELPHEFLDGPVPEPQSLRVDR